MPLCLYGESETRPDRVDLGGWLELSTVDCGLSTSISAHPSLTISAEMAFLTPSMLWVPSTVTSFGPVPSP